VQDEIHYLIFIYLIVVQVLARPIIMQFKWLIEDDIPHTPNQIFIPLLSLILIVLTIVFFADGFLFGNSKSELFLLKCMYFSTIGFSILMFIINIKAFAENIQPGSGSNFNRDKDDINNFLK